MNVIHGLQRMKKPDFTSRRPLLTAVVSVVLCLWAGSCYVDDQDDDDSRLELSVSGSEPFWHPSFPDSVLTSNNSLVDSAGLAGLEIQVLGHTFGARSFRSGPKRRSAPGSGDLRIELRLVQGDQVVAQSDTIWKLRTGTAWHLNVTRGLAPEGYLNWKSPTLDNLLERPSCGNLGMCFCGGVLRIRLRDWAANFPEEGLWLRWFSLPTNPPDDVIYC